MALFTLPDSWFPKQMDYRSRMLRMGCKVGNGVCGSMQGGAGFSLPSALTDLQLPLNASLAALPVVRLGGVVF